MQRFVKNLDDPYPSACELSLYLEMQMEPLAMAPTPTSLVTAVRGLRLGGLLGGYRLVHEKISDLPGRINQVGTDLPPKKNSKTALKLPLQLVDSSMPSVTSSSLQFLEVSIPSY